MKVIIVGGVAGGASCAARLRRLDETAEIVLVERGPYVSYANCGLPYYVGGVIEQELSLFVANEQTFGKDFMLSHGYIQNDFDVEEWAAPEILEQAAAELLEERWQKETSAKLPDATTFRLG